jgi:hypothetical protein
MHIFKFIIFIRGKRGNSNVNKVDSPEPPTNKIAILTSNKITNHFLAIVVESFPAVLAVLARLTARGGLAFAKICTSYDLQKSLIARGFSNIR